MATILEAQPAETREKNQYVILIHGTFSYQESDEGTGWWQRNSAEAERLGELLGSRYRINPEEIEVEGRTEVVPDGVFHWSGNNSERARRLAAKKLLTCLDWYEKHKLDYHLVAHSHGGSVLWEALQLAACRPWWLAVAVTWLWRLLTFWRKARPSSAQTERPLAHLKSWTTVGTPFFHSVPSLAGLKALILLMITLGVLYWQRNWFRDYWDLARELFGLDPFMAGIAFTLTYLLWPLAAALLALTAYRLFKVLFTQRGETRFADIRRLEFWGLLQSFVSSLLPTLGLILWYWFVLPSITPTVWRLAWTKQAFLLPVLYEFAALALVFGCLWSFVILICQAIACRIRVKRSKLAWKVFGDQFHYLAYLKRDEAINGLRKSQYGINGPLLPRIKRPGARDYSPGGRTMTPEALPSKTRFGASTFFGPILLPLRQVYDWVVRPVYNEVFAVLVDEFVLGRFTAQAHGADVPGLRLGFVSSTPFPLKAECPQEFRRTWYLRDPYLRQFTLAGLSLNETIQAQIRDRFAGPSASECEDLLKATHARAGDMVEALRSMLGVPSLAAVSLIEVLSNALKEGGEWADLLIHTTYFKHDGVRCRIAKAINPHCAAETAATVATFTFAQSTSAINPQGPVPLLTPTTVSEQGAGSGAISDWPPSGFGWSLLRGLVRALLLASPAMALYLAGLLILYPESREYQIHWASRPSVGLTTLIRDAENDDNSVFSCGQFYKTPPSVRWFAAVHALELDGTSSIMAEADQEAGRNAFRNTDIEARAARKLIEIGKSVPAEQLLKDAFNRVKRDRLNPRPDSDLMMTRIDDDIHLANAAKVIRKQLPPQDAGDVGKREIEIAVNAVCGALCSLLESPGSEGIVDFGKDIRAAEEVVRALKKLTRICARYGGLTPEARQSILGAIDDVVDTVSRSQGYSKEFFEVLRNLVKIDQLLQEQGCFCDAEKVICSARSILAALPLPKMKIDPKPGNDEIVADCSVLLAKAHRWPEGRVQRAEGFLTEALRLVNQDPESTLQDRVELRARIACGYARLGRFQTARKLSDDASIECRINVATQMLINEHERRALQRLGSQVDEATALARCWKAFDEQD